MPEVGGTKDADIEKIAELKPDLVIANKEENTRTDILKLEALGLRVFVSFPLTVAAGLAHTARLARTLGLDHGAGCGARRQCEAALGPDALDGAFGRREG